ncbi:DUF3180 domain-containing protein [Arthrobacter sp. 7Tela_A1]|uniref:DUF3180 domain-containing protein n=1 Tax=Arthrobacter sp. 7Tela_A1 TaxID=3093745 RepID=UPI003BB75C9A
MRTIRYRWLAVVAVVCGIAGWQVNAWTTRNGFPSPVLGFSALLTLAFIVGFTLFLGLRVRRWRDGDREKPLDPIAAARTLVLAQATAYAGALLLGWHGGIFLDQLGLWEMRPNHGPTWASLAMSVGGMIMIATGLVVERFCKLPPEDKDGREDNMPDGGGEYA